MSFFDLRDLSSLERHLVACSAAGYVLECGRGAGEQLAVPDDPEIIIRAEAIQHLLAKWRKVKGLYPHPRGLRVRGAHITGTLDLTHVQTPVGLGLYCCRLDQAVELEGAHLPWLSMTGSRVPAVDGNQLRVDGDLELGWGFCATGGGQNGAGLRLRGARIGGQLVLSGAELTNPDGPALVGDRLQVDGDLFLGKGFRASGNHKDGAVRLMRAHIGGMLDLSGAELTNPDGLVLDLTLAETKQAFLPSQAICSRAVADRPACNDDARRVHLDGFVYSAHDGDWRQWLHLISQHTPSYWPQPYQQLAAVQRAAGHDSAARDILIAQQQDIRQRGHLGGWLPRALHLLWGLLGGYGYRIHRLALALLIVLIAAGGLGIAAGHTPTSPERYVAMHTSQTRTPGAPCSLIEQIGVGIDRGLPLPTTQMRTRCDFDTTSRRGQLITAASWMLQALVWALATLVVAGYSGLIRKTT